MERFSTPVVALCLGLIAALCLAGPPAGAAYHAPTAKVAKVAKVKRKGGRWKAYQGPFFNDPHITSRHFVIERRIIDTIRHARKGSTIRIAVYSFDGCRRRGVGGCAPSGRARPDAAQRPPGHPRNAVHPSSIGTNVHAKSFIYKCRASCRGTANEFNNMHAKWYSFTQAGKSTDVMAIGSANMMLNADLHQWNDLYFMSGDHELFEQFTAWFADMKHDYSKRQRALYFCGTPANGATCDDSVDKYTAWIFPRLSGPKNDLVLDMLDKIQCLTPDGAGGETRTSSRWPCTPCAAPAATTSPRPSGRSGPRAATSGSTTG